jgi:hypothetical protein
VLRGPDLELRLGVQGLLALGGLEVLLGIVSLVLVLRGCALVVSSFLSEVPGFIGEVVIWCLR